MKTSLNDKYALLMEGDLKNIKKISLGESKLAGVTKSINNLAQQVKLLEDAPKEDKTLSLNEQILVISENLNSIGKVSNHLEFQLTTYQEKITGLVNQNKFIESQLSNLLISPKGAEGNAHSYQLLKKTS